MKALIALAVLALSAPTLRAANPSSPGNTSGEAVQVAALAPPFPTAAVPPPDSVDIPAKPPQMFTAPPIVVGPDNNPTTTQYQPMMQPGVPMMQPGMPMMQPGMPGQPIDPYGNPMMGAPGPPGGMMGPGGMEPIFPYKASTPDVTMAPAPTNGPLPDRYGWVQRYDFGLLPSAATRENAGNFSEFEFDLSWKYTTPLNASPIVFSFTQQYDLRLLNGPEQWWHPALNLPGALHRIGWDFEFKTVAPGEWNAVVAFNPSIDSDFEKSLSRDAWNWDARAAFLYTPSREITVILGAVFWDRLTERILPWAGVIYRPNHYWQFDLTFPQLRVATFMWDEFGFQTSLYGRIEYHSEAYQIYNPVANQRDRVELTDWRAMIGVNKDRGNFAYFFEGGWVFARNVDFKNYFEGFDVTSGAMVRAGLRY